MVAGTKWIGRARRAVRSEVIMVAASITASSIVAPHVTGWVADQRGACGGRERLQFTRVMGR